MQLVFSRDGAMPLGRLRVRLQVAPGAVTNAIDRLEYDGLVRREAHPTDGRVAIATVTRSGRALGMKAARVLNEKVYEPLELPPALVDSVFQQLQDIRRHLGDIQDD
jgi:DNA-binding MarR family transcriptional regulator